MDYDFGGAAFSALPGRNKRQLEKTFCSAAHVSALVASGRLAPRVNFSEWHPHDVAKMSIYRKPKLVDPTYLEKILASFEL